MKETKKKRKNYSSIYEEKGEVEQYLRNHHTSIQAKKKKSTQKISQVQNSVWYTPWEDNYGPPIDINPTQDTFEDYPVNYSRSVLNLFLLFKLIYAGVIYSIMVYKSNMSSGDKICESLFLFYGNSGMHLYRRLRREIKIKTS